MMVVRGCLVAVVDLVTFFSVCGWAAVMDG